MKLEFSIIMGYDFLKITKSLGVNEGAIFEKDKARKQNS